MTIRKIFVIITLCIISINYNSFAIDYYYNSLNEKFVSYDNGVTWARCNDNNENENENIICYHYNLLNEKFVSYDNGITWEKIENLLQIESNLGFLLNKNPISETLAMFNINQENIINIKIIDMSNNTLYDNADNTFLNQLDVEDFKNGVYFIKIFTVDKMYNTKFIVNK